MKAFAVVLAVIFFIVAALYALGFLQFGAATPGRHLKHALLFAILGALSLVWMRFQTNATSAR